MPAPAPAEPPIIAPFAPPEDAADDGAANRAAANLRGALTGNRVAFAIDRVGLERDPRAVGEHDRGEPDAEPRAFLQASAALDQRDLAVRRRAGGNRDAIADAHVAGDARQHFVLDAGALAADRRLDLQSDD